MDEFYNDSDSSSDHEYDPEDPINKYLNAQRVIDNYINSNKKLLKIKNANRKKRIINSSLFLSKSRIEIAVYNRIKLIKEKDNIYKCILRDPCTCLLKHHGVFKINFKKRKNETFLIIISKNFICSDRNKYKDQIHLELLSIKDIMSLLFIHNYLTRVMISGNYQLTSWLEIESKWIKLIKTKDFVPQPINYIYVLAEKYKEITYVEELPFKGWIESLQDIPIRKIQRFDPDPLILGFNNGALNILTKEFYPGKKSRIFLNSRTTLYDYKPKEDYTTEDNIKLERLKNIINQIIPLDNPHRDTFESFLSAALYNGRKQVMCFMIGNTFSGKSTIISLMKKALGEYHHHVNDEIFTRNDKSSIPCPVLSETEGGKLITISEINSVLDGNNIKKLTESMIISRANYSNNYVNKNSLLFLLDSNADPLIKNNDTAVQRLTKINFTTSFKDSIPEEEFDPEEIFEIPDFIPDFIPDLNPDLNSDFIPDFIPNT